MEYKAVVTKKFFPKQYENGVLIDVMDRTITGFRVQREDGTTENIIVNDNNENAKVLKGDHVIVSENNDVFDIRLDGEEHE